MAFRASEVAEPENGGASRLLLNQTQQQAGGGCQFGSRQPQRSSRLNRGRTGSHQDSPSPAPRPASNLSQTPRFVALPELQRKAGFDASKTKDWVTRVKNPIVPGPRQRIQSRRRRKRDRRFGRREFSQHTVLGRDNKRPKGRPPSSAPSAILFRRACRVIGRPDGDSLTIDHPMPPRTQEELFCRPSRLLTHSMYCGQSPPSQLNKNGAFTHNSQNKQVGIVGKMRLQGTALFCFNFRQTQFGKKKQNATTTVPDRVEFVFRKSRHSRNAPMRGKHKN